MAAIYRTPHPKQFSGWGFAIIWFWDITYWFSWLEGGGSKYYGCDISTTHPQTIFRLGIWNNMVLRHYVLVSMVKRRGFKILWLRYIEEKKTQTHFQGGDSEYYGCETLTYWFPWLGGGGSKYYGRDISMYNFNVLKFIPFCVKMQLHIVNYTHLCVNWPFSFLFWTSKKF